MDDQLHVVPATDVRRFVRTDRLVWFNGEEPWRSADDQALGVPEDQRFGVEVGAPDRADPATYAGIYGVRPIVLGVPDGGGAARPMPAAGLTWVGVHPDHRRRGVLTAMIADHLARTREAGLAASLLHASEPSIYGRYGYGVADVAWKAVLGSGTTFTAPGLDEAAAALVTRLTSATEEGLVERLRSLDERLNREVVGNLEMHPDFYAAFVSEHPEALRDKEPLRFLFAQRDGVDVGVATFRREPKWEDDLPAGRLSVIHLAGDPAARLALLRRLVDFDLMGSVKVLGLGPDDPIWSWVAGPRGIPGATRTDALWLRPVDLPALVAARGYEQDCDVVLEVADDRLPDNAGRWRLAVAGGTGRLTRTDHDAEVSLTVAQLGGAWLGGSNLVAAHRAGVLEEHRPGAVLELDRALRTALAPQASPGF